MSERVGLSEIFFKFDFNKKILFLIFAWIVSNEEEDEEEEKSSLYVLSFRIWFKEKRARHIKKFIFSSRVNIVFAVWLMDNTHKKRGYFFYFSLNVDIVYKILI